MHISCFLLKMVDKLPPRQRALYLKQGGTDGGDNGDDDEQPGGKGPAAIKPAGKKTVAKTATITKKRGVVRKKAVAKAKPSTKTPASGHTEVGVARAT